MAKIFGIDLGTTYSCIAFVNDYGQPEVVPNEESQMTTPSVVAFEEGGSVSVGDAAKEMLGSDPDNVCSTIKREMGKRDFTFNAFGVDYTPETISSLILKKVVRDAAVNIGEEIKDVVITCPAYFGLEERKATENAGVIAGLNVLGILNEPTAAAISYGLKVDTPQTVMVFDLGGGTFDVTILKVENGKIQVVATGGDHKLGGKDWDDAIREYVINQYAEQTGESTDSIYDDNEAMGDLELKAENAKKSLTQRDKVVVKLNGEKIEVTREKFEERTRDLLESTINLTRSLLEEAKENKGVTTFDKLLLVGGSTMMPQVMERLKQEFPDKPIEFSDPNQSVAKGAAIYGLNMAAFGTDEGGGGSQVSEEVSEEAKKNPIFRMGDGQAKPINIVNVLSHSIAIRLIMDDDKPHIVNQIYKQTEIPCTHELHASTVKDNQQTVLLEIFENGSSEKLPDESQCKELVSGEMGPLPPNLPAGAPITNIFKVDENGLLTIDVEHKPSGVKKHLEVNLKDSLSQKQIEDEINKVTGLKLQ